MVKYMKNIGDYSIWISICNHATLQDKKLQQIIHDFKKLRSTSSKFPYLHSFYTCCVISQYFTGQFTHILQDYSTNIVVCNCPGVHETALDYE